MSTDRRHSHHVGPVVTLTVRRATMIRKKCQEHGHKWVAWNPGGDPWCVRWFCKAKAQAPVMALIERALESSGGRPSRIRSERVSKA